MKDSCVWLKWSIILFTKHCYCAISQNVFVTHVSLDATEYFCRNIFCSFGTDPLLTNLCVRKLSRNVLLWSLLCAVNLVWRPVTCCKVIPINICVNVLSLVMNLEWACGSLWRVYIWYYLNWSISASAC